jgi:predicted nucleic acid-binding protein
MSVVSNASPLINLALIGQLDMLRQLYGELVIPDAVWREVVYWIHCRIPLASG